MQWKVLLYQHFPPLFRWLNVTLLICTCMCIIYTYICTLEILQKICFQTPDGKVYASTSNDEGRSPSLEYT